MGDVCTFKAQNSEIVLFRRFECALIAVLNTTHLLAYNPQGKGILNSFCMDNSTLFV